MATQRKRIGTKFNVNDGISGVKMADYLRKIADAVEKSDKLYTAKVKLTVFSK